MILKWGECGILLNIYKLASGENNWRPNGLIVDVWQVPKYTYT